MYDDRRAGEPSDPESDQPRTGTTPGHEPVIE